MEKFLSITSKGLIAFSAVTVLYVSLMAFISPQGVMSLVRVTLDNTDAMSSIRGAYGGVGLVLTISFLYLIRTDYRKGLLLLSLLWGFYSLSRTITIFVDGPLGEFGSRWLTIESALFIVAITLWIATGRLQAKPAPANS